MTIEAEGPAVGVPGEIDRVPTGIPGLDAVTKGGLPRSRLTLVAGTAGSGKTVFAAQFLAEGIRRGEPGVFVTFEERPEGTRGNLRSLGMTVEDWEAGGQWRFVNAAPRFDEELVLAGAYDLSALIVRVRHAVEEVGARRVAIDSVGALIAQFDDLRPARHALFHLASELEALGVTSIMTAERADDYGAISRYGFEEFVADNVLILRNALETEKRRRTVEVLKLRGGSHLKGEHLFTLLPRRGMVVVPMETVDFGYGTSDLRRSSGNQELDEMLRGGFFDRSLVLVSGPTGTGKSLMAAQFIAGGITGGEKALLLSFEESRDQLMRNARSWGVAFEQMERAGQLRIVAEAPESASIEDHLLRMKAEIDDFRPDRVAIDSLTALQRVATVTSFREYLLGLTFHIKMNAVLGLVTSTSSEGAGGGLTMGDLHVSTISDTILLLQYIAVESEVRRGINVLKMRGSNHDKAVREFVIDDAGMHIGEPFGPRIWSRMPQVF
jgi:circadian clock protein KaiC